MTALGKPKLQCVYMSFCLFGEIAAGAQWAFGDKAVLGLPGAQMVGESQVVWRKGVLSMVACECNSAAESVVSLMWTPHVWPALPFPIKTHDRKGENKQNTTKQEEYFKKES